jgi:erythritol transport system ATP-binding protein
MAENQMMTDDRVTVDEQTAAPETGDIILRAEKITKYYPGTVALDNVDFKVHRGKVNALVGENGAGKSTLMKIIAGVEQASRGQLFLNDQPVEIRSPHDAEDHGIGIIYQELNLFPNLSVSENIFMAREMTTGVGTVRHKEQKHRTWDLLTRLEQPISPNTLVGNLRVGQQQIVEIAKALAQDMHVLIMDEPTSALSTTEVTVLFRIIEDLKAQGVTIIYISHKLEEILQIGDYITVLRDGRLAAEAAIPDIDLPWIIEKMVGRTVTSSNGHEHDIGSELLRVEDMTLPRVGGGFVLDHVSFSVNAGEILGIYGLMGAGRTELLECLMGLHPDSEGKVSLDGKQIRAHHIGQRINAGLMMIPEDRQRGGLVQTLSVARNMTLASLYRFFNLLYLDGSKEEVNIARMIDDLDIRVASPQQLITSLSGGNQQKVVVAKALLTDPKVLLMDEPTRGIDVAAKGEIFQIMYRLAEQGLGIIFVSTELKEVLTMADRILVMSKGKITGAFDRAEATEEALVEASAVGHGPADSGG